MPIYTPSGLLDVVETEKASSGPRAFITARSNRPREKWSAAKFSAGFSKHVQPCQVDIAIDDEQREYDFHLLTETDRFPFQVTEVLTRGRKRGDEYKVHTAAQLARRLNEQDELEPTEAIARIREEMQSKIRKYRDGAKDLHLLVYVNLRSSGVVWSDVQDATADVASGFASVWLHSDTALTCLYGGGRWPETQGWWSIPSKSR